MKRIIKTYETCSDELLALLAEKFPNGIKDRHISQLTTIKGERIRIVELQTEDTMYLIKFSNKLEEAIDNIDLAALDYEEDETIDLGDDEIDTNIPDEDIDPGLEDIEEFDTDEEEDIDADDVEEDED